MRMKLGWKKLTIIAAAAFTLATGRGLFGRSAEAEDASPVPSTGAPASDDAPKTLITPELARTIGRGLKFLARQQNKDGGFDSGSYTSNPGITGLACMAFMSAGSQPGRGEFGSQVEKGLDFVMKSASKDGVLTGQGGHGTMYTHGFATMFLGEIAGMSRRDDVLDLLRKAVGVIRDSQSHRGGWRYTPFVRLDDDLSVSISVLTGLRAAANAGVTVERNMVNHAILYTKSCAAPDGGFGYQPSMGGGTYAMNAAGVAALYFAGEYESRELKDGIKRLRARQVEAGHNYYYSIYYAAQAMYLCGEVEGRDVWEKWYAAYAKQLAAKQTSNGAWGDNYGEVLATSFALIVLQIPNNYLPIFER